MDSIGYTRFLLSHFPARRLAEVMAIRTWRRALRPMALFLEGPDPEDLLRSFGASGAAELPAWLRRALPGPLALASPVENTRTALHLAEAHPGEAARILALAGVSLQRRITIFGREVALPSLQLRVPHTSRGWVGIDWEANPLEGEPGVLGASDPKYAWAMGRLEEVVHLACGALLCRPADPTKARSFANAALDRMVDFAQAPRGVQWSCAMEVALRAANMAIALRLLAGDPALELRPGALLEILRSLSLHVAWVQLHLEDTGAVSNNHLVADHVGILTVAALLPGLPGARATARRSSRALAAAILEQTLEDGFSFEGSTGYHRLALELFLLGDLCATTAGVPLPARQRERLAQMFEATKAIVDGEGRAPRIGDDDSGRCLPFYPRDSLDHGWLLPIGAALFDRPDWKLGRVSPELLWLLGVGGAKKASEMERAAPPAQGSLREAGIYALRSKRVDAWVACGPNGTGGLGTHGHNDKLSIEVRIDGALVIADPGSGSYTGDPSLRNKLRGTAAHSTVVIDGQEQQLLPADRLFALPEQAYARCLSFESHQSRVRFEGEHRGYRRLGAIHRRRLSLDRETEELEILDTILGEGTHRVEVRFLIPREPIRISREGEGWRAEIGPQGQVVARLLAEATTELPRLEPARYAPGYGQVEAATSLVFTVSKELPMRFRTVLLPPRKGGS